MSVPRWVAVAALFFGVSGQTTAVSAGDPFADRQALLNGLAAGGWFRSFLPFPGIQDLDIWGRVADRFPDAAPPECGALVGGLREGQRLGSALAFYLEAVARDVGNPCFGWDPNRTVALYHGAIERGDKLAPALLGNMYLRGRGVAKNPEAAGRLFQQAALRHVGADPLGVIASVKASFVLDMAVPAELVEALAWSLTEERRGPAHQFGIARQLMAGDGLPYDPCAATAWVRRAARADFPPAQHLLATWILDGIVTPRFPDEAAFEMYDAALAGHVPAMIDIGTRVMTGDSFPQDDDSAYMWLLRAYWNGAPVDDMLDKLEARLSWSWVETLSENATNDLYMRRPIPLRE